MIQYDAKAYLQDEKPAVLDPHGGTSDFLLLCPNEQVSQLSPGQARPERDNFSCRKHRIEQPKWHKPLGV